MKGCGGRERREGPFDGEVEANPMAVTLDDIGFVHVPPLREKDPPNGPPDLTFRDAARESQPATR
jgi:hypothetical protein